MALAVPADVAFELVDGIEALAANSESARHNAIDVSSVHAPAGNANGPPPTMSVTGANVPGGENSTVVPTASPTARPSSIPRARSMIEILLEARRLVERPGNDFLWSGWEGVTDAVAEIDGYVERLRAGEDVRPSILFLPTGPLQELALSSGWGDEFLALADRYDAV